MNEQAPVDFFISHAGQDREYAGRLFALLIPRSHPFLDTWPLALGKQWDDEVQAALNRARVTVVVVSQHTKQAYYQKVEIRQAIDRATQGSHLVVPVFLGGKTWDVFELTGFHGIMAGPETAIEDVAERLLGMLGGAPAGAARPERHQGRSCDRLTRGVATTTAPELPEWVKSEWITENNAKRWLTDWEGSE